MNKPIIFSIFILFLLSGFKNIVSNQGDKINKVSDLPIYTVANANNMFIWVKSNGITGHTPWNASGIYFPQRAAGVIYTEGIVWGGNVIDGESPQLRVGGSTYLTNLDQGAIMGIRTGNYENPSAEDVRLWRVHRNWQMIDLLDEVLYRDLSEADILEQYETDWDEWPATKGAPFEDVNGNGLYDPLVDIPGMPGADQTIWYVANDLAGIPNYGSPAIGLEMQTTIWSYERPEADPFQDISFKRVVLIYKGTSLSSESAQIEDMYISQWVDPDIGGSSNDFVGCDSLLNLGYGYNAEQTDWDFDLYNLRPPSFGYCLIQGPVIPSEGDTAIFNFQQKPGNRNLDMSSFFYYSAGNEHDGDPSLNDYNGTVEFYNLMSGLRPQLGTVWQDPVSGQATHFPLSGNPLTEEGWIDGIVLSAGDRRMGITSGPFDFAIGDSQEVIIALIGDNCSEGRLAYLQNVEGVRRKARNVKDITQNGFAADIKTNTLVVLNQEILLQAYHLLYDPSLSIIENSWEIIDAPQGSIAALSSAIGESVSFAPDLNGTYIIGLTTTTDQGNSASAMVEIFATDNQAANVSFTLEPHTIVLGDSVYADGSATYDPEGDSLEYNYSGGGAAFETPGEDETKSFFKPMTTGERSVTLTAFDGLFESAASKTFRVTPLEQNVSTVFSFIDSSWFRTKYYFFYQDKLLIGIEPLDIVRIYQVDEDSISFYKDINIPYAVRVYKVENNKLYIGTAGNPGYGVPGPLSIYQIENDWEVTPIIENYLPGIYDITSVTFTDNFTIIADRTHIYMVDLTTNPAAPQIFSERSYQYSGWLNPQIVGQYIYVSAPHPDRVVEILSKESLDFISEFEIAGDWRNLYTEGQFLFVGFYDSLQIYNIQNPLIPVKLSTIQVLNPFNWHFMGQNYTATSVNENLIAVNTDFGITFYDITNPMHPVMKGGWYGGRDVNYHKHFNSHYIYGNDLVNRVQNDIYSGINKVTLDFKEGDDNNGNLPNSFKLYQNYPNPFNPRTTIKFYLPQSENVILEVYNIMGQRVSVLLDKKMQAGIHEFSFKNDGLASGVYFYKLKTKSFIRTKKMLLLK